MTPYDNFNAPAEKSNSKQLVIIFDSSWMVKIFKFLAILLLLFLTIKLIPYIQSLFVSLGISFIIAFLLNPLVDRMESRGLNRGAAVLIIFAIFISIIVVLARLFIPAFAQEIGSITQFIQNENPDSIVEKLQIILSDRIPALQKPEIAHSVSLKLHMLIQVLLQKSATLALSLASSFILIITIPFITFFMLKDGRKFKKWIIQMIPNRYFEMSLNLMHKSGEKLGGYIRGQLMVSTVIGTLSVIAMFILHIPYFFIIGVVAGLANMIPYFGPWVGALPGVIVAFMDTGSLGTVLAVIIAFAIVQLLDNVLVSPLIVSRSVQIHPLLVILVLLVGSALAGIVGMLIAVPVFAVIQVIVKEVFWAFKNYRLT
ncbi:MAG: AI-2E family transporter [Calditrichaeota bacterium]|nr:AI-2E family transporter [Calditrichota bacterium]